MAKGFVVDTDKARQVGDRLSSIGRTIESFQAGPQPRGTLGTGVLERAWGDFERSVATARQDLARSVGDSGRGFTGLAQGATALDQRKADEVESI